MKLYAEQDKRDGSQELWNLGVEFPSGGREVLFHSLTGQEATAKLIASRYNQYDMVLYALRLAMHRLEDIGRSDANYRSVHTLEHCEKVLRYVREG